MRILNVPTTTICMKTGKVLKQETTPFHMMPVDTSGGQCADCGAVHDPDAPHNNQSLPYQYAFYGKHGYWPTWADALAHCSPEVQAAWKQELIARKAWNEPEGRNAHSL